MLAALRSRAALRRKAGDIYGAIVTQARRTEFYDKLGIPDTPLGRYNMVVLHLFLVLERLGQEAALGDTLRRALLETFIGDMDDSLRELGTGDVVVGKRVRRAAAGFYERARDYRIALAERDRTLVEALVRYGLVRTDASQQCRALETYVRAAVAALAELGSEDVQVGRVIFPNLPSLPEDLP